MEVVAVGIIAIYFCVKRCIMPCCPRPEEGKHPPMSDAGKIGRVRVTPMQRSLRYPTSRRYLPTKKSRRSTGTECLPMNERNISCDPGRLDDYGYCTPDQHSRNGHNFSTVADRENSRTSIRRSRSLSDISSSTIDSQMLARFLTGHVQHPNATYTLHWAHRDSRKSQCSTVLKQIAESPPTTATRSLEALNAEIEEPLSPTHNTKKSLEWDSYVPGLDQDIFSEPEMQWRGVVLCNREYWV